MRLSQSRTEYTLNPLKGLAWSELLAPEFIPRFSVGRYCLIRATRRHPLSHHHVPLSCILRYCSDHRHVSGRQGDRDWQRLGIILFRKDSILRSQANCAHTQLHWYVSTMRIGNTWSVPGGGPVYHPHSAQFITGTIYTRRLTIFCHCMTSSVICKYIAVVVDHLDSSFRMGTTEIIGIDDPLTNVWRRPKATGRPPPYLILVFKGGLSLCLTKRVL